MRKRLHFPVFQVLLMSSTVGLMCGCSGSFGPSAIQPNQTPIGNIQGSVHGGQAPISGAKIYLFATGVNGYGSSPISLINSSAPNGFEDGNGHYYVMTDANGNFALGGDYTCTEGQQVYMVAWGGNPGLTGSVNNTAIMQMAGLGQCPAAGNLAAQVPYLVINEVTTVAFAYAMSGFGSQAWTISSNAANSTASATAIANAMANANNIVNLWPGTAPAVTKGNANSINPQTRIHALANILATCVNTASPSSSGCTNLFNAAVSPTGTPASDESSAIFNIVHNPANTTTTPNHVTAIWNLYAGNAIFTPTLTSAPSDWTMPVIYKNLVSVPGTTGNQITSGPFNMAFDASGDAWIGDRVKGVVEIGPQGAANTYNPGFGMVKGVAISPFDGNVWVSDYANSVLDVLDESGNLLTTIVRKIGNNNNAHGPILTAFSLYPGGGFLAYQANEDIPGVVLFDDQYNKVDYINGSRTNSFPDVNTPGWIAVDQTGTAWLPSTDSGEIGNAVISWKNGVEKSNPSEATGPSSYSTASDGNSNIWMTTNTGAAALKKIAAGGTTVTQTISGGGMNAPYKLSVDGANTIWIANDNANTVSAYSSSTSSWLATNGFSTSAASGTGAVVLGVDGSGNVWTGNADGSVTQLLGLATPTATPFYGGMTVTTVAGSNQTTTVTNGNLGAKP